MAQERGEADFVSADTAMKTYSLPPIRSPAAARVQLNVLLPGQTDPWLLLDAQGDAIAYFSLDDREFPEVWAILADTSGRHYHRDPEVLSVLENLRSDLGGEIVGD